MPKALTRSNLTFVPTLVQNWEAAGALLADAAANYLHLSTSLAANNRDPRVSKGHLVSRIDASLQTLHKTLDQQLHQSRVALANARNKWASPIYRLPEEILLEIFIFFVYGPSKNRHLFHPDAGERVRTMYQHLYALSGVCTGWRKITLSHPMFWSILPMVDGLNAFWDPLSIELSTQRSDPLNLHVVVDATHHPALFRKEDFNPLIQNLQRAQSLNIRSQHQQDIPYILPVLFRREIPEHLSDLSLTFTGEEDQIFRPSPENDFVSRELKPLYPKFPKLMRSLRVFRINNVPFQWKHITFSARLVELRIEKIALSGNLEITAFMTALSSACSLRDLKIIQVEASADSGSTLPESRPLSLPRLKTVYFQDLYFNSLRLLLRSIAPCSHRLTLNLSDRVKHNLFADSRTEDVPEDTILQLLAQHTINKLILADDLEDWAVGKRLNNLLRSLPALKSLEIYFYELDNKLFKSLEPASNAPDVPFPKLEVLEFRGCTIPGIITGLPRLVNKQSLQRLVLGQDVSLSGSKELAINIDEKDKTVRWLKANVPGFRFILHDDVISGFSDMTWEL
ncbi:unnamed protein product [Rhizoctonia solani]|uniref:F-box domain-containing protein n=1 Tax=Rhizoctonia solani TaxID=456999 RepID=A0A8H3BJX2_9AGAM|nr:unnamed protein product [Rhizoctonia solani]